MTHFRSINPAYFAFSNREDIREALSIAARGKVHCHHTVRGLSELEQYVDIAMQLKILHSFIVIEFTMK